MQPRYDSLSVQELRKLAQGDFFVPPDHQAQFQLGRRFSKGSDKDEVQAAHWFRLAADSGHAEAQRNLAFAYLNGRGLAKHVAEGIRRLRIAAEAGDAPAQRQLGYHYATGSGVPADEAEGARWFGRAAAQGDAFAQYNLAFAHANGRGVPVNPGEAVRWYQMAADQDMPEAQCALALAYEHGMGVAADLARCAYWNQRAADKEYAEACSNLGWLYENGLGVPQDLAQARHWYEVASRQDFAQGSARLASLNERRARSRTVSGPSVPSDLSMTAYLDEAMRGFVGLEVVRQEVFRQASYIQVQKLRAQQGLRVPHWPSRHQVFLGNPGTGKTSIARVIAGMYERLGLLKSSKIVETDRSGLVAPYIGQTALKTRAVVESALGGILFVDEAYALARSGTQDFGKEAIETLLKMMEDHRDDLVVIVAGYTTEMQDFLQANPGLASRFNRYIHFPDYTPAELLQILLNFCSQHSYLLDQSTHHGLRAIFQREIQSQRAHFSNAGYVRNLFEKMIEAQAQSVLGLVQADKTDLQTLLPVDVESALGEKLADNDDMRVRYDQSLQKLKSLVGLRQVKQQVNRLFAFVRLQRARAKTGSTVPAGFSQHLVFTGNPGTGKTLVARIIADLYFGLGIIPSNRIVEVDRSGLVAGFVGQSAIKTREVVESALGGVLFIDEAYALTTSDNAHDFGAEVIDTLLKMMEDHRNELVVIVAGYTEPMQHFIEANPGLRSRFNHYIAFDDYAPDELLGIFETFCHAAEYALDAPAREYLLENFQSLFSAGRTSDNARFVRNLFERSIEIQAERLAQGEGPDNGTMDALTVADLSTALLELNPSEKKGAQAR